MYSVKLESASSAVLGENDQSCYWDDPEKGNLK